MTMTMPGDDVDYLAVDVVCQERIPMPLRGADRMEAVRRLTARGLRADEIARLLCMRTADYVYSIQRRQEGVAREHHTDG